MIIQVGDGCQSFLAETECNPLVAENNIRERGDEINVRQTTLIYCERYEYLHL